MTVGVFGRNVAGVDRIEGAFGPILDEIVGYAGERTSVHLARRGRVGGRTGYVT